MWTKTVKTKFKNVEADVLIWLSNTEVDYQVVSVQSMVNEFFLIEEIRFEDRDKAYDFIKHYPVAMANAFLLRESINVGAWLG